MNAASKKQYLEDWRQYRENIAKATPIDLNESVVDKQKRIQRLELDHEAWFKYYFPNFYTCDPAPWHIKATKRVMDNPEFYEVRPWARELSKSGRTMMEVLKLIITGKKKNVLLLSSTYDNAERLLLPYKSILEANNRIINDYGEQRSIGRWEAGEFVTKNGVAFRGVGAGQNPRGSRNDEFRPDVIIPDDVDTDETCRNKERVKKVIDWFEQAVIPTRSISNPLLIIGCGNIIAKYSLITEMMKKADHAEIVNIRDKYGKSTWPQKNTEANIDRVLSQISFNSAQKEYFNNPIIEGDTFKSINYGKCPPMKSCERVLVYSDPATSNKDRGNASTKSVGIIGYKDFKYYVYWVRVGVCSNATFVSWLFEAYKILDMHKVDPKRLYIENNSLQDPFYEQVILPLIWQQQKTYGFNLPITPDSRKKPEKFDRIEGTLEPLHRLGNLIFNETEKGTEHMELFEQQWLGVGKTSKTMDGPDMVEGGVWLIQNDLVHAETTYRAAKKVSRRY